MQASKTVGQLEGGAECGAYGETLDAESGPTTNRAAPPSHGYLRDVRVDVVRIGNDTDTNDTIAGGCLAHGTEPEPFRLNG